MPSADGIAVRVGVEIEVCARTLIASCGNQVKWRARSRYDSFIAFIMSVYTAARRASRRKREGDKIVRCHFGIPPRASGPSLLSIISVKRALAFNTLNDNDFFNNNNLDPLEARVGASLYILTFKISKLSHNVNTDNKYPRIAHSCPFPGICAAKRVWSCLIMASLSIALVKLPRSLTRRWVMWDACTGGLEFALLRKWTMLTKWQNTRQM